MGKLQQEIILFDLDGTLTDSAEGVIRSAQYMQEKMGIPPWATADLKFIVGPPLMMTFREDFGMSEEDAKQAFVYFRERYASVGLYENKLYPDIEAMLIALKTMGKRMAVATSKKESSAHLILEHFGIASYFEVVAGDDAATGRDTKAKVIAYVLERMQANKEDVIMVGDRKFDVEGAHAMGVPCIGVLYGYGDLEEFQACQVDYLAKLPMDVVTLFG